MEDLIHDEGEELQGDEEDVVPRLEREAAFRQAAPRDDLSPEELEKFVNERYKARANDMDMGRDVATSERSLPGPDVLMVESRCDISWCLFCRGLMPVREHVLP